MKITKLLVANRGEIAIRVFRAASELGISTVGIYTYEDRYSLHRYKADEAYQVGEDDEPLRPYLAIEAIIAVAKENGVDAIHPGYGFLSENADLARRCREEGIIFVGPRPEVMEALGDKVAAKAVAQRCDVPLIESNQADLVDIDVALTEAHGIGYPVMLKAASGGGGRGMRVIRDDEQLRKGFFEARNEALNAFGDDTVFLEKFVERPKHIEVQLVGDQHGHLTHLYERDCSVQRRFQKVVEVAPAVDLSESLRQRLYEYALKIGRAVGYDNVGTVEFLVNPELDRIYFIEVNPRIQVEHTVTEMITGVDIVKTQLYIAAGYPLEAPEIGLGPGVTVPRMGVAVQCRITTEDATNDFQARLRHGGGLPLGGRLRHPARPGLGVPGRGDFAVFRFAAGEGVHSGPHAGQRGAENAAHPGRVSGARGEDEHAVLAEHRAQPRVSGRPRHGGFHQGPPGTTEFPYPARPRHAAAALHRGGGGERQPRRGRPRGRAQADSPRPPARRRPQRAAYPRHPATAPGAGPRKIQRVAARRAAHSLHRHHAARCPPEPAGNPDAHHRHAAGG